MTDPVNANDAAGANPDDGQPMGDDYRHENDPMGVNDAIDNLDDDDKDDSGDGRPAGLPDEAWNAETGEVDIEKFIALYDQTSKRMNGLRTKLAKGETLAPKDVAGYEVSWPEGYEATDGDNKALDTLKNIGVKYGMTNDQMQGLLTDFLKDAHAEGGFWTDFSDMLTPEEQAAAQAEYQQKEIAKLGPNGTAIIRRLAGAKQAMVSKGILTAEEGQAFEGMVMTADAANVLNKLMPMLGLGDDIPSQANTGQGRLKSDAEIIAMQEKYFETGDSRLDKEINEQLDLRTAAGYTGPLVK